MRLSFWQFLLLIAGAVLVFFLLYMWWPRQDNQSWIERMNKWIFSSEGEVEAEQETQPGQPDTW